MDQRDSMLEARLKEQLRGCCFGNTIYAFAECDSTMERAHALVHEGGRRSSDQRHSLASEDGAGSVEGTLVFAARQTQGRGRLGRRWESPDGGAYFSLILRPNLPAEEIPQLSLVAGLSAAKAIQELTGLTPSIRWPNDLLLDGRKLAGILLETTTSRSIPHSPFPIPHSYVVLGIGINVTTDPKVLPDAATSLSACGASCNPYQLVAAVCKQFGRWYDVWTAGGFAPIRESLRPWLSYVGQMVRLTIASSHTEGQTMDVDETGRLLVRLDSGLVRAFDVGEVSLLR